MRALVLLTSLALITATAQARIGETPEECIARYGEPVHTAKDEHRLSFRKAGMLILAWFYEGKCERLGFEKEDPSAPGGKGEFTETEIKTLKEANGRGAKWTDMASPFDAAKYWTAEGGGIIATYQPTEKHFGFFTKAWMDRQAAATAAAEKKKLEGF